jgi:hypothetical protein
MRRTLVPRFLPSLDLTLLNDGDLHGLGGDIALAAKTSALVLASPALQAAVADIATNDASLAASNQTVADDRAKLRIDIASEAVVRNAVLGGFRAYVTLVANRAQSYADVGGAGLPTPAPREPRNTPPTVPVILANKPPRRGHGKTTVSVDDLDADKREFAAQQSLDEGVTWTQLGVGHGKTRVVTGPSGTMVWVRFAMVRWGVMSAWSAPIVVTIP